MSEEANNHWIEGWNRGFKKGDLRVAGQTQQWFWLKCRKHVTFKTSQAVHSKRGPRLTCIRCEGLKMGKISKGTSAYEMHAWRYVEGRQDVVACFEVKILRGLYGPADMYLAFTKDGQHHLDLVIQVDGQGHFDDNHAIGNVAVQQQQQIDADFDSRCWALNKRLLRLHWRDSDQYAALISKAVQRSKVQPCMRFSMYSSSYKHKQDQTAPFGELPFDEPGRMNHKRRRS